MKLEFRGRQQRARNFDHFHTTADANTIILGDDMPRGT